MRWIPSEETHVPETPGDEFRDDLLDPGLAVAYAPRVPSAIGDSCLDALDRLPGGARAHAPFGPPPAAAGRYRVDREIGRGGAGIVYEGYDLDLEREVAIKVLRPDRARDPRILRRFLEEARIESRLEHPNIAAIYDLGFVREDLPFFAMKLVRGRSLAELLHERADPASDLRRFLGILEQVCRTVADAHAKGLIHRDLKPANVMVGEFGEVCVLDWGLARVVGGDEPVASGAGAPFTARTRDSVEGAAIGTVAYMPPEQARGDLANVTARSDVFALGAILAEILTGEPPHAGRTCADLRSAAQGDLVAVRARLEASGADDDLVALATSCLAADAAERPSDAATVAAALRAHLASAAERAHRAEVEAAADRVRRAEEEERERIEVRRAAWERAARRRTVAIAGATLLAVLLAAGFVLRREAADAARVTAATAAVDEALDAANRAEGAEDAARAAQFARRAVDLARVDGASPAVARRAADALARAEAAVGAAQARQRDARLFAELDRADEALRAGQGAAESEAAYRAAFAARGVAPTATTAEILTALRGTQDPEDLAAALESWALLRKRRPESTEAEWRPLADAAQVLAPDPWRRRLLDAALAGNRAGFRATATEAGTRAIPVRTLHLVSELLSLREQQDLARPILLATWGAHPDDPRLNQVLCVALGGWFAPVYLGGRRDLKPAEAVRFAWARVALSPDDARAWIDLGGAMDVAGEGEGAEAACRRGLALAAPGKAASFRGALGDVLRHRDRPAEAVTEYLAALEAQPKSTSLLFRLGLAYRSLKSPGQALAVIERGIAIDPTDAVLASARGDVLLDLGRRDEARAAYRSAIERNPKLFPAYGRLAESLTDEGRLADAVAVLRRGVAALPDEPTLLHNLGTALVATGAFDEAIPLLRRCIEIRPGDPETFMALGNAWDNLGKATEAEAAFRQAIALDPKHAGARTNLAWLLAQRNDGDGAIAELNLAVAAEPTLMQAWFYLGQFHQKAGRHTEAAAALRKAEALAPDDTEVQYLLGISLCDGLHDYPAAIACFRRRIAALPSHVDAHISLALALRNGGDPKGAAGACRAALEVDPSSRRALTDLGTNLYLAEEWAEAAPVLRRVIAGDPSEPTATMLLAWVLVADADPARRRPEEALALIGRAEALAPENPQIGLARGLALVRLGREGEAVAPLEAAAKGGDAEARLVLAAALAATGRAAEARDLVAAAEAALAKEPPAQPREVDALRAMAAEALRRGGAK